MNIQSDKLITKKDVESELEYMQGSWKIFFEWYYRLNDQRANYSIQVPQQLIDEIAVINNVYKDLTERIAKIVPCFPE